MLIALLLLVLGGRATGSDYTAFVPPPQASEPLQDVEARVSGKHPPFVPLSDPFSGSLKRPTQKADS